MADSEIVSHARKGENLEEMIELAVNRRMEVEHRQLREEIEREFEERSGNSKDVHRGKMCDIQNSSGKTGKNDRMPVTKDKPTHHLNRLVKSPSDTTIYAPAFVKLLVTRKNDKDVIIDQISNFVDEMRLQHDSRPSPDSVGRTE